MDSSQTIALPLTLVSLSVFICSASTDQTNVTAKPDQNVTLPCRGPDRQPVVVVEWSRADLGSAYVFLYRNKKINLENQHPSFKNRVDLQDSQLKDGDASLLLRNVTTDDGGTYECRVVQEVTDNRKQTILIIKLDVLPPPGDPDGGSGALQVLLVGVVVSLLVLVVVVAVLVIFCIKKRSRTKHSEAEPSEPTEPFVGHKGPAELNQI